jgi:hypothetical protein
LSLWRRSTAGEAEFAETDGTHSSRSGICRNRRNAEQQERNLQKQTECRAAGAEFAETDGTHRIMNAKQGRKNTECENWDETSRIRIRVLRSVVLASRKRSGHCPTRDRERERGCTRGRRIHEFKVVE